MITSISYIAFLVSSLIAILSIYVGLLKIRLI